MFQQLGSSNQTKLSSILDIQNVYWSRFVSYKKPRHSSGAEFVRVERLVVFLAQASCFNQDAIESLG